MIDENQLGVISEACRTIQKVAKELNINYSTEKWILYNRIRHSGWIKMKYQNTSTKQKLHQMKVIAVMLFLC